MKTKSVGWLTLLVVGFVGSNFLWEPRPVSAQQVWPWAPPPGIAAPATPAAQRNAMNQVRTQVGWVQNATRTATSYSNGVDMLFQQFQYLRGAYGGFVSTLNPRQQSSGANDLAELSAGLNIIAEAFANYQDDVAGGRAINAAMSDLCRAVQEATRVWLQEFNRDCNDLRAGW